MAESSVTPAPAKNKGGRPRKSVDELRASGSWRAKERAKSGSGQKRPATWDRQPVPATAVVPAKDSIMEIPGYDPHRDKGECEFDAGAALRAVRWFHTHLTHVKGQLAGQGLRLTPLQQGIIANLFGWKRPDGSRRYRKAFIYVPRKWGKTLIAAGVALYTFFECRYRPGVDWAVDDSPWEYAEGGVEAYCAAAAQDQAKLLWDAARFMVRNDETLSKRCRVYQHSIARYGADGEQDGSFFKAIAADSHTAHGFNPQVWVLDELHAQKDGELLDVLDTGTASRTEPMALMITTADYERESICNEEHDHAVRVRDGVVADPFYLPVIFEADIEDDWRSEEVWSRVNPNYPVTPTREYMESRASKADGNPRFLNTFLRLNLNVRTQSDVQWLDKDRWDACAGAVEWSALRESLRGRPCYAGLDLSSTDDLTAFSLFFPEDDGAVLSWAWCPTAKAKARAAKGTLPSYLAWSQEGALSLTAGDVIDHEHVLAGIVEICERYSVQKVAVDRFHAEWIEQRLMAEGLTVERFGQGFVSMSGPAKRLEVMVGKRAIRHGGHPVLRWAALNAMIESDAAGNIKPTKATGKGKARRMSDNKIDPLIATVMAVGIWMGADVRGAWSPEVMAI